MVDRNLPAEFAGSRFICFTDRPEELPDHIETAPLPADLPKWWSKLGLFQKGLFPDGDRVLFFDLDTVITGAIDELVKYDGEFATLTDFYRPLGLQSSVMAWRAGARTEIWEEYAKAGCPTHDPRGDQWWIEFVTACNVDRLQKLFPLMFVSYKQSAGKIPDKASIVVFHGFPRPHDVTDGWVPKVWCVGGLSHAELKAVCNVDHDRMMANVASACARKLPWFDALNNEHERHVAIVGGGPSVTGLFDEIEWRADQGQDIWVLNNAYSAIGGIKVDAQVILDARPENAKFICNAREYLIASQCAPEVFNALAGRYVTLWHANSPGMAEFLKDEKERVTYLVGGGTTVGLNALALAFLRGYRKIHLYGFDSSYRGDNHHAYPQTLNEGERTVDVLYGDKHYKCAPWMAGQANEFMEKYPQYEADGTIITVHGEGLLPDIYKELIRTMTPAEIRADEILKRVPMGSRGVEVGVFAGDMSRALLKADPDLELIMIDSWEGNGDAYNGDSGDWHAELTQSAQDDYYERAKKRVKFAGERAHVFRKRSTEAASGMPDGYFDFVFLDADHSYEGCKADIEAWLPKVKPGGLIGGHDYRNPDFPKFGVTKAVDEFVRRYPGQFRVGENFCWFMQLKG